MFTEARVKLTGWYLAIIMMISLSFSGVIYFGVNRELTRIENFQKVRIQRIVRGIPAPFEVPGEDQNAIEEARNRIIFTLTVINLSILVLSGGLGYFLAGKTLEPIAKMMSEQKEFVGNASHELRTPLTSLKTEIEVALRSKSLSTLSARKLLKSNLEEINKIQSLSNYLLRLNKYENDTNFKMEKVDLKEVATKAVESFNNKNIKTDFAKSEVFGNAESIIELITILLDNAVKYGEGKRIDIKVKNQSFQITDHGKGISEDDLPHIFDRFYRADKSRTKDGYGLGLSIAKQIADLNNAKIEVDSKVNKGTSFEVVFS